ncbi:type I methionyl aminopeptidase [Geodermatophilus sp. SYSU D00710]
MVELKSAGEIDAMRAAGRVVASVLEAVRRQAAVGVSLRELDDLAREELASAGARSTFLGYRPSFAPTPFPAVLCTSVNDAALHGIPTGYRLRDGDVLSVDCGASLDGWAADAARTVVVGAARPEDARLVETTAAALVAGIAAAVPGNRIGDVSAAVGAVARRAGYGVNTDYGGHGIGRAMHEDPPVPNDGRPGRGPRLRTGLVIAIEPWFLAGGGSGYRVDEDGWTLRSADGSRAAHAEHTVAVTAGGPRVLTAA